MDTISGFWKKFICFRFRFSKRVTEYQFLFAMMFEMFDIWTVLAWIFAFILGYCLPPDMKGIFSVSFILLGVLLSVCWAGEGQGKTIAQNHYILPSDREITGSSSPDMLHSVVCRIERPWTDQCTGGAEMYSVLILSTLPWDFFIKNFE